MSTNEWLVQLKVGDMVIMRIDGRRSLSAVTRITPTQIIIPLGRFRKSDGRQVGENQWHPCNLEQATPEQVEVVKEHARHRALSARLRDVAWANLPLSVLEQVNAVLESHTNAEKSE